MSNLLKCNLKIKYKNMRNNKNQYTHNNNMKIKAKLFLKNKKYLFKNNNMNWKKDKRKKN